VPRHLLLSLALVVSAACGGDQRAASDSATRPAPPGVAATARDTTAAIASSTAVAPSATAAADTCPMEGDWAECKVVRRLTDAGYRPLPEGDAASGVFPVAGTRYAVGSGTLHIYVFPSARERERAVAVIDTVAVAPRGAAATWGGVATLVVSNNLAAVLVSDNGRLIERVQNALTAGLPRAAR
jgi:hypothetical protein